MTGSDTNASSAQHPAAARRAAWRWVLVLVALVTIARIVFLLWFSPYELTGDEAHYWEWSRRPALSYYTKGPGVAWAIAASTSVLGTSEATVRLPAVIASAIAMLGVAALGAVLMPGVRRAPLLALLVYLCVPVYHATALLMTIDGPMIAAWAVAGLGAALALRALMNGQRAIGAHALLGAAVGVGFLFKYTIILMALGVVAAWIGSRRHFRAPWAPGAGVAALVALACASPVIIWNEQHGWPTVAHLLWHIDASPPAEAATAEAPDTGPAWTPVWMLEMIGAQLAFVGPALVLMLMGMRAGARSEDDDQTVQLRRLLVWCGAPTLLFYLGLTLFTRGQGNWPIGAYTTFVPLAAVVVARARPGWPRALWHWSIGYGLVAAAGMLMLPLVARVPGAGSIIPVDRFSGARETAREVERVVEEEGLNDPIIIAARYQRAGLLAFYMTGRPVVYCAQHITGDRRTSYDDFADTSLRDPALHGRDAVLIGSAERKWVRWFNFDWTEQVRTEPVKMHAARGFRGPSDLGAPGSTAP